MELSPTLVCLNRPVRVAHERPGRRWLDRTAADCYEPFGSEGRPPSFPMS